MNAARTKDILGPLRSQAKTLTIDFDPMSSKPQPVTNEHGEVVAWYGPNGFIDAKPIEPSRSMTVDEWDAAITELLHDSADRSRSRSTCYFIGGEAGPIKIGHSVSVKSRIAALQACSPVVLNVLATALGGADREAAYHQQFKAARLHGEWFERTPELLAEITRLSARSAQ